MSSAAIEALVHGCQEHFANPHAEDHALGWRAAEAVDRARTSIASRLGAEEDEVVFTSGATEASNIALLGIANGGSSGRILVSAVEHEAVLAPARELGRRGHAIAEVPVGPDGTVDLDAFESLLGPGDLLASIMLVNNEIGTVQPIAELAAMCAARGVLLHVDAVQALGWMTLDVGALGADMLSVSAHKVGGPKGVGALFVRREIRDRVRPIVFGGGQEGGLRPGTVPVPLCASFAAACDALPNASEVAAWRQRTSRFAGRLVGMSPGAWVNGGGHPGNVSLTLPGVDADLLVARLRPRVAVSRGSACASGVPSHSHVLRAIGLSAADCAATIRLSTGPGTTLLELDEAAQAFSDAVAGLGRGIASPP